MSTDLQTLIDNWNEAHETSDGKIYRPDVTRIRDAAEALIPRLLERIEELEGGIISHCAKCNQGLTVETEHLLGDAPFCIRCASLFCAEVTNDR